MNTINRTPETIELNARLQIVRLDELTFNTPNGRANVRGYGFRIAGLGYVRFNADAAGIPYSPNGGKRALQSIIDDGGFTDYNDITFVNALNEPTDDFTIADSLMTHYCRMKITHPDALMILRNETTSPETYELIFDDAHVAAGIIDRNVKFVQRDTKFIPVVSFPCHDLDTVLPKIIHAGHRVAICDIAQPRHYFNRQSESSTSK
jgi:hypothetical protein